MSILDKDSSMEDHWTSNPRFKDTFPQPAPVQEPVPGVVIRDGLPTLLQERDIKPTDARLYTSLQSAPVQEPVAWMHEWEDGERIPTLHPRDARESDKPTSVRPLVYGDTSPQPAHRKPLTDDQAMALTRGALNRLDVVRKTEAAHGIKENT